VQFLAAVVTPTAVTLFMLTATTVALVAVGLLACVCHIETPPFRRLMVRN
jgi:hypothetical protein